ncbi:hypothetical protein NEISICOT_01122 [Neisseria sicca ATCC 29256]|uniref:Uncharacterized protein n=1 Tax=Neisseria sicca ATCC 29256 TaxID=547045 RepID=C6M3H4_NEISI|nr:hypothetical protein NEISICOT_01122 [Neisseria sicca ATCC 29256]
MPSRVKNFLANDASYVLQKKQRGTVFPCCAVFYPSTNIVD